MSLGSYIFTIGRSAFERKRGRKICCFLMAFFLVAFFLIGSFFLGEKVICQAGTYDDAYTYYQTYGDRAVFVPESVSDGYIYFGIEGRLSSASIRYLTLGWKATVYDCWGIAIGQKYLPNDGRVLKQWRKSEVSGYQYLLYRMSLQQLIQSFGQQAITQLKNGNASIVFDACDTTIVNGQVQGAINENGVAWGTVYTTYDGIANAAPWTEVTRENLKGHFGKRVENLFYTVQVSGGTGIRSVSGGGTFCYGMETTIRAVTEDTYSFKKWDGGTVGSSTGKDFTFRVTENSSWVATAVRQSIVVNYYRNQYPTDRMFLPMGYSRESEDQRHPGELWRQAGYRIAGWSTSSTAGQGDYFAINEKVSSDFLSNVSRNRRLYAVWKPNQYGLHFDGNGGELTGANQDRPVSYSDTITLPQCMYTRRDNCKFLGWSLSSRSNQAEYLAGQQIAVETLAQRMGITSINGATIIFYAIWDQAPSITAYDMYFPLEQAREGKLTEAYLSTLVKAVDKEDGNIPYGYNQGKGLWMEGYESNRLIQATELDCIPITFVCVDSQGNRTTKAVAVRFADTMRKDPRDTEGAVRFISLEYLLVNPSGNTLLEANKGGLLDTSIWRNQTEYRTLLIQTLKAST